MNTTDTTDKRDARALGSERLAFSRREVAQLLGVSLETVKRWTRAGLLPSTKIRGRCLVARADVLALVRPQLAPAALAQGAREEP